MQRKLKQISLQRLYKMRDAIDLNPDFQRTRVWSARKMQLLVDTILRNMDIPKFYLWKVGGENYECVDGQQRFRAIFRFYDNQLKLPEGDHSRYAGRKFRELPKPIQRGINRYKIDAVILTDASELDVAKMFDRLQRGVPTNPAEKLNAMPGGMKDFVKNLANHHFFSKTSLTKKRMSHNLACAQITLVTLEGAHSLKFGELEKMYKINVNFDGNNPKAKKIKAILDYLDLTFTEKAPYVRNRATVISLFLFVLLKCNVFGLEGKKRLLRRFFKEFHDELHRQIALGKKATDPELLSYQACIIQGADTKESIARRHNILVERYKRFIRNTGGS